MTKKVLVLGATGHLGAYSALALKDAGWDVIATGRRSSDGNFFAQKGIRFIGGIQLEDKTSFNLLKTEDIGHLDAVVHLAGIMPAHSDLNPMPYVQSIIVGMVNVCEWMKSIDCKRIVFNTTPSDVAAFFGSEIPIPSDAPRAFPKSGNDHAVYAICKMAATDILEYYQIKYGFKPCVFRHFMVYGWHPNAYYHLDGISHILPYRKMIRTCIAGKPLTIWGNPNIKRDILYIKDFADAIVVATKGTACGMFNLTGDKPYSLEEQIKTLAKVFAKQPSITYDSTKPSAPQLLLDGNKMEETFGWKAKWSWEDACVDMLNEHRCNTFEALWGKAEESDIVR